MGFAAYLDIETTGLSPSNSELTVIGLYIEDGSNNGIIQLTGDEIRRSRLSSEMKNISMLYTYNGARFDLPFIMAKLDINLAEFCSHKDLMYSCWKRKLFGGLKSVERQLGIERKLPDVDGWMAVELWNNYIQHGDMDSFDKLLKYNEEDVLNLRVLREMLKV